MKKVIQLALILFSAAALRAEITVWTRSYLVPMNPAETSPEKALTTAHLRVTPGEFEPAAFAVRADGAAQITVEMSGIAAPGWLPADWCELRQVKARTEAKPTIWLHEIEGPVSLEAGRTEFFWITVRTPATAAAGTYRGVVYLQAVGQVRQVEIECEVLGFRLAESPIIGGMFMADVNLPPGWYEDMKAHGIDAVQYFWGYEARVVNAGGRLVMDLGRMDRFMKDLDAAGLAGPVIISLGNDYHLHYERRIAEEFGFPLTTGPDVGGKRVVGPEVTPQLDSLFVEGLRQIRDHWRDMGWPQELVVLIYDEPTERLLERAKNRYDLLKTVMPGTRVYGVVMDRREWAQSMLDQMDIIVANGDFPAMKELAVQHGKDYWVYSGLQDAGRARFEKGCLPWQVGASGAFSWMYNYYSYDPDGCMVLPDSADPGRILRSIKWEAVREGKDDLRYFATAERLIANSAGSAAAKAAERLAALKNGLELRGGRMRGGLPPDIMNHEDLLASFNKAEKVRAEVIDIIRELLKIE
ncbi:MAG: glycoside hydrolase domain-containing protein [Candidatus Glassbacteria bacterium]